MNKYGIEHFHIEEIEECDDNIVNEREVYWIKFYNSYHNGYNATYGGEGRREYDGEEFYQLYQQGLTCVEIAQIKNCDPGIVGKYLRSKGINTFTLQAQRAKQLYGKKCRGIKNENIIEFSSMMDAARYIVEHKLSTDKVEGVQTHISQVCNGKRKTAYGYKWELI